MDFRTRWLQQFQLTPKNWRQQVREHARQLPFVPFEKACPLFEFLFGELPGIVEARNDDETILIANAYGWCCFAFWQCESAFPALPENYALHLKTALLAKPKAREASALLVAKLIVESGSGDGRCGFNKLVLDNPEVIRESEKLNHEGRYDVYLKAQEKYDEYLYYLEQSQQFIEEWDAIKRAFPEMCKNRSIVRRSPIPERNWNQTWAEFTDMRKRFQAVFDFFCWKYFLWGMEGDTPLLLKASVVMTPHGTQIFIPGYISFDPRRDLNYPAITRLHKARGIPRQGPGYSEGRKELAELVRRLAKKDAEAKARGLKGAARYTFICDETGFRDQDDFRRLRELLARGKQQPRKKP